MTDIWSRATMAASYLAETDLETRMTDQERMAFSMLLSAMQELVEARLAEIPVVLPFSRRN